MTQAGGRLQRVERRPGDGIRAAGAVAGLLVVYVLAFAGDRAKADFMGPVLVVATLSCITLPLLRVVARVDGGENVFSVLVAGYCLKVLGTMARYYVIFVVYEGNGDAGVYDIGGKEVGQALRQGRLLIDPVSLGSLPQETKRIAVVTGWIYGIVGPNRYSAFFVFSWLGFLGILLGYLGMVYGFPGADRRRYRLLAFFIPSALFWPSSVGKDALVLFGIGLGCFGAGLILGPERKLAGAVPLLLGLQFSAFIRPHVAALLLGAFVVALVGMYLFSERTSKLAILDKRWVRVTVLSLGAVIGIVVMGKFGAGGAEQALPSVTGNATLNKALAITQTGRSAFVPHPIQTPLDIPAGLANVFLRPFPWSARSMNAIIASLEVVALLVLLVKTVPRLRDFPLHARANPYLLFCFVTTSLFVVGFSNVGNEGILVRQRTQMLPTLLLLFATPLATAGPAPSKGVRGVRT